MSPTATFTSDEGAYALQVRALQDGSWAYDYKAAPSTPRATSFPIILSDGSGGHHYPYVKHPAFPLLLLGSATLFGTALGLHLPGLLGVVGAAVAAWLLAKELGRPAGPARVLGGGGRPAHRQRVRRVGPRTQRRRWPGSPWSGRPGSPAGASRPALRC